jgi:hypothetical protein
VLKVLTACLLVGTTVTVAAAQSPSPLQASAVLDDVQADGARTVLDRLVNESARWNEAMADIARGDRQWLDVAVALRAASNSGASELLDEAVFIALKPAPVAVLRLLRDQQFDTECVCSSNVGTDHSTRESRRFVKERIKILGHLPVGDAAMRATRDRCVKGLRAALPYLRDDKRPRT